MDVSGHSHNVGQDWAHPSCVLLVALSQRVPSSQQGHSPSHLCVLWFWQAVAALKWKRFPAWKTGAYCASRGKQTWHFTGAHADRKRGSTSTAPDTVHIWGQLWSCCWMPFLLIDP